MTLETETILIKLIEEINQAVAYQRGDADI